MIDDSSLVFLVFFLGLSGCASDAVNKPTAHYLTVLHTNDNHGRFWHNEKGDNWSAMKSSLRRIKNNAKGNFSVMIFCIKAGECVALPTETVYVIGMKNC